MSDSEILSEDELQEILKHDELDDMWGRDIDKLVASHRAQANRIAELEVEVKRLHDENIGLGNRLFAEIEFRHG